VGLQSPGGYEVGGAMFSAIALSFYTGMAALAGLIFPFLLKICKALTITAAFIVGSVGYLLLAFFHTATNKKRKAVKGVSDETST
jgi:hypothetical protein